jgi:hypothetical protein
MMRQVTVWLGAAAFAGVVAGAMLAQGGHVASPPGVASTEIRGKFAGGAEPEYRGGKWIEVTYGRPIKRGRDLWGAGQNYGQMLNSGAPVWRAGANMSTRLKTELPLVINGKPVPAGEYSLFIELKPQAWTLIVSRWAAQKDFNPADKNALWGSFDYTPAKDVVRAPMKLETLPHSVDQLTWQFLDMSDAGGSLAIEWDKTIASVPFKVGP